MAKLKQARDETASSRIKRGAAEHSGLLRAIANCNRHQYAAEID